MNFFLIFCITHQNVFKVCLIYFVRLGMFFLTCVCHLVLKYELIDIYLKFSFKLEDFYTCVINL